MLAIFVAALIITIKYFDSHQLVVVFVVITALVLGGLLIFALPSASADEKSSTTTGSQLSLITSVTPDPFTYTPGSTNNGTVTLSTSASYFVDEQSCAVKSVNTVWSNLLNKCMCQTGWFGNSCAYETNDNSYVSLTSTSKMSITYGTSTTTDSLTLWPSTDATSGCTNQCTLLGTSCLGVTYSQGVCTPITALTFSVAPIHDASIVANSTTIYLKRDSLQQVKMVGYYNVIFGALPPRYFVGNIVSGLTGQNYFTDNQGSRILYFTANTDNIFSGIPSYIIVNSLGTLYVSTSSIPSPVVPNSLLVSFSTPAMITKDMFLVYFGKSTSSTTFYVRYVPT